MAEPILIALQLQQPADLAVDVSQLDGVTIDLGMEDGPNVVLQSNGLSFDMTLQVNNPLDLAVADSGVALSVTDVGKAGPRGPMGPEGPAGELESGVIIDGGFF